MRFPNRSNGLDLRRTTEARLLVTLKDLKPDPRNARKRTDRSASLIQESLQRFGAARSIVIDEDGRILAGNGTVEGAKAAGINKVRIIETEGDEIVAVRRTGLTEEQKIGLALADNRTSDLSEWDGLMLQQLSEGQDLGPWFDEDEIKHLTQDGWDSDIEAMDKHNENLDGIQGKIVVKLDNSYRDEVIEAIRMYCDGHAINAEIN